MGSKALVIGAETFSKLLDWEDRGTCVLFGDGAGAVVLVGHDGQVVFRKAYGYRALLPAKEPMTVDTVFDVASLTKVVATTSCMMSLFERGKVNIDDPVTVYLPEFQGGQSAITVRQLMTNFYGFRPDLDL